MIHDKLKKEKKKNAQKKRHYLQQQRELHYWPRKRRNLVSSIPVKIVEN